MRSSPDCRPRLTTKRTNRPTRGHEIARVADLLGTPFLPHQRWVVDVALEQLDNGRPAYREVLVTTPRQSGKSALMLSVMIWSALQERRRRIAYTAQTGSDARKKLKTDFAPMVMDSDLAQLVEQVRLANGEEAIIFVNGSRIEALPSTLTAGHGMTLRGGGFIDEAFADVDDRREQAMLPAMATCPDAQLWIVSTAGTEASAYLKRKVELGRAAASEGRTEGLAYFEWSAPDDADPDDVDTWRACMPAFGRLTDEAFVRHARQSQTDGEFRRAWLNQWTKNDERVIPESSWLNVQSDKAWPNEGLVFGVDITLDRARASVVVADNAGCIELVENRDGTDWIADRLRGLVAAHGGRIVVDQYGPAGNLVDELSDLEVVKYGTRDSVSAANALYDAIMQANNVIVRPHDALSAAVGAAQKKPVGSGWLWARTDPAADLSPLHAATVAWHCAKFRPKRVRRPVIF